MIQSFPTGGDSPTTGFAGDFTGNGLTDLVVGNNGDGHLALLLGGSDGLSLSQTMTNGEAPNPTGLSFAGVSDGGAQLLRQHGRPRGGDVSLTFNLEVWGSSPARRRRPSAGGGPIGSTPESIAPASPWIRTSD